MLKVSKGFSLIELVCTLLILNILVVSAIPKLNSVKTDATIATLLNLKGSVKSANSLVFAKAMLNGNNTNYSEKEFNENWFDDCRTGNCVKIGDLWVYLKYSYIDRNSSAFILNADISGLKTKEVQNNGVALVVPDRGTKKGEPNGICSGGTCTEHDFCQCRIDDRSAKKINGRDNQYFVPRFSQYPKLKNDKSLDTTVEYCYFRYSSAEYISGYPRKPVYFIEISGC